MQLLEPRRSPRRRKRWTKIVVALSALVLVGLGWLAWKKAHPRYLRWKQDRALTQAKEFIAKNDPANAQLALEVALKAVPGNPDTIRVAADMLEQANAPQAMRLRRAVVQIEPDSAEDAAALVLCCLRFRDYNAAKDALSSTRVDVAAKPPMLRAALAFAIATDNGPVADAILNQLRAHIPNEPDLQIAHSLLHLKHSQEEMRLKARRELEEFAKRDPRIAIRIHREFAGAALQRGDYAEARIYLERIIADPEASLKDHLQRANIALVQEKKPFEPIFEKLAPIAVQNEADAVQFAQWLLVQGRAAEFERWIANVPPSFAGNPALRSARADALLQLKDWDRFEQAIADGAWGRLPKETFRLAFAARTVDSPARPSLRKDTWELALASARGQLGVLRTLQRLAAGWEWADESERTLWTIARSFPDQTWAHQALFNLYRGEKNTAGMREVMSALRDSDASVRRYQHDWALLTLLLEPTSNWNQAKDVMKELHEADASDATYATGYAFALAQAGRAAEALAVVDKLSGADREYPPRQPFLAFIYGVGKRSAEMETALTLGSNASFLPEESYLFTRAREELTRKPPGTAKSKTAKQNEMEGL